MKTDTKGEPHRFPKKHDPLKILKVLETTDDKKTSVIKEDLVLKYPEYEKTTIKWFNETLQNLEKNGLVQRIEKRKEKAYYWVITEAGIKARDTMRKQYTITIKTNSAQSEVAAEHFMAEVFKLAEESHLSGGELNIIGVDLPEETLEEAIERVGIKKEQGTENK